MVDSRTTHGESFERNSDRIGLCFMLTSLGDLDRNYWHHLNYLETAHIRTMFRCIVELNLNDFINIHMQAVFSLHERRYVSGELGLSSDLALFVCCFILQSSCRVNTGPHYMSSSLCVENIYCDVIYRILYRDPNYRLSDICTYFYFLGSLLKG